MKYVINDVTSPVKVIVWIFLLKMADVDAHLTGAKKFKLGLVPAEVSFVSDPPYVLAQGDIASLIVVFSGQMNLSGPTMIQENAAARTRVSRFLLKVAYQEIRGLVAALRVMAGARTPVVTYAQSASQASFHKINEICGALNALGESSVGRRARLAALIDALPALGANVSVGNDG